jgi:opacity protein-like surface antigen
MHSSSPVPYRIQAGALAIAIAMALLVLPVRQAVADDDLFGLYVGGAVGDARVRASPGSLVSSQAGGTTLLNASDFDATHSAFKVMAGVRPISLLGAEIAYMDFGHPSGNLGAAPSSVDLKGAAVFAVTYLPVSVVDVIVKVGLARLENTLTGYGSFGDVGSGYSTSSLFRLDRTNTNFAIGGGLQYAFGPLAVRAEYERYEAAGGSPSLLTAGVTWTF